MIPSIIPQCAVFKMQSSPGTMRSVGANVSGLCYKRGMVTMVTAACITLPYHHQLLSRLHRGNCAKYCPHPSLRTSFLLKNRQKRKTKLV